ncbi:MAG: nicotinate-nucleotide adenylyltransferase [Anaerolineales bacterium]
MRIGIFGGTFDPPHVGHLVLAAEALDQLQLECVLWVLTPSPPHKPQQPVTDVELRVQMLQAAIAGEPSFKLSRVDIKRRDPYYARDTMQMLKHEHPGDTLIYLMGGDSLRDLPDWHQPQEFLAECDAVGVMLRPGAQIDLPALEHKLPGISQKVRIIGTPLLEISSTDIRKRVAQQRHYRYFLPEAVYRIIEQNGLYH